MPKKKTSKVVKGAATKKAKAPVKKTAAPVKKKTARAGGPKPVAAKGSVGFRLRMNPATHKQLTKMATQNGVSQNTMINQLIQDAK